MAGLTPTMVLRYLNRNLGALVQEIELTEDEMMRVVFQESLKTYSKYFPFRPRLQLKKDDLIPGERNIYKIHNEYVLNILNVAKLFPGTFSAYGSPWIPFSTNPFDSQILADQNSMTITPITWRFDAPNRLTVFPANILFGDLLVEFKCEHPNHLKTIQQNMRDQFLQLCLYDVEISLLPIKKRFASVNTVYGTLEPYMDLVENAKTERENLLKEFETKALMDGLSKRLYIA